MRVPMSHPLLSQHPRSLPPGTNATGAATAADGPDVFDRPALWRYEAVAVLDIDEADLPAAMSPGPTFPTALRAAVAALPSDVRTVVDLGAGTGGASEWVRSATGAAVIAVEPAPRARLAAQLLFPELRVVDGSAEQAPLSDASADVVTLWGVSSLLRDLGPALVETARLLRDGGHVVIGDLVSSSEDSWCDADNSFRSIEELELTLLHAGFSMVSVGCGNAAVSDRWGDVAGRVDDWIERHCTDRDGFDRWRDDKRKLADLTSDGSVLGAVLVGRRAPEASCNRGSEARAAASPTGWVTSARRTPRVPTVRAPADVEHVPGPRIGPPITEAETEFAAIDGSSDTVPHPPHRPADREMT
jgi:SAM-dependent methyltransferase